MTQVRWVNPNTGRLNISCISCGRDVVRGAKRCRPCNTVFLNTSHPFRGRTQSTSWVDKRSGPNSYRWGGGRFIDRDGYVKVLCKEHPNAQKNGYVFEHRMVMSTSLGRPLKKEESIHHINGNKSDNRIENLLLCPTFSYHLDHEREEYKSFRRINIRRTQRISCEKRYILIPRQVLEDLYIGKGMSMSEIATVLGVSKSFVHKRLHKYGITARGAK